MTCPGCIERRAVLLDQLDAAIAARDEHRRMLARLVDALDDAEGFQAMTAATREARALLARPLTERG